MSYEVNHELSTEESGFIAIQLSHQQQLTSFGNLCGQLNQSVISDEPFLADKSAWYVFFRSDPHCHIMKDALQVLGLIINPHTTLNYLYISVID